MSTLIIDGYRHRLTRPERLKNVRANVHILRTRWPTALIQRKRGMLPRQRRHLCMRKVQIKVSVISTHHPTRTLRPEQADLANLGSQRYAHTYTICLS